MTSTIVTQPPVTRRAARANRVGGLSVDEIRAGYRRDHRGALRAIGRAESRRQRAKTPVTVEMPMVSAFVAAPVASR